MTPQDAKAKIEAERTRQINQEGWSADHDDGHDDGSLLRAAVFYYQHAARPDVPLTIGTDGSPVGWPWDAEWWKPKDDERDLVRAGALCLAERDRLRRLQFKTTTKRPKYENPNWMPSHVAHKYDLIVAALAV